MRGVAVKDDREVREQIKKEKRHKKEMWYDKWYDIIEKRLGTRHSMLLCLKFKKMSQSIDNCPENNYNIDEPGR